MIDPPRRNSFGKRVRNQFDYLYEGAPFDPDITRQGHRKGVGGIWFDNNNHGRGNFFSVRTDKELREFELDRIVDENAAQQSLNDPKGFMQELYKDPSHLKKITSTNK